VVAKFKHLNPKRILVVKTHAIGDLLMTTPAIRAIRQHFPDARIDLLTGSWSADAVSNNSNLDGIIKVPDSVFHSRNIFSLIKLIKDLRKNKYDLGVIFQPSKAIHFLILLSGVATIAAPSSRWPCLVTYPSLWRLNRNRYVVEDFLDVVRAIGINSNDTTLDFVIPDDDVHYVKRHLSEQRLIAGKYVVICPGGGRNPRDYVFQKIWPSENYCRLSEHLLNMGIRVVIAGSEGDLETTERVRSIPGVVDWVAKTTFSQLAEVLRNACMMITNDSAPMHLALAVGCPFVAIFGPSRSHALLPQSGKFAIVQASVSCAPCYDNEPLKKCHRGDCIQSVQFESVIEVVMKAWSNWNK